MNTSTARFSRISRTKNPLRLLLALGALCAFLLFFPACQKSVDYFDYVSELRSNIFLAQTNELSLRVYAVQKETPYASDGVPREISTRTEVFLTAPSGEKEYALSFTVDGREYGGDMSYDNVKSEYYYSCTLDVSDLTQIPCRIVCGDNSIELTAISVLDETTLTPQNVLSGLLSSEQALFDDLTDKYGFAGEIYLRLIYEESPYYYVGVIDRDGGTHAFLLNAKSGRILARRES